MAKFFSLHLPVCFGMKWFSVLPDEWKGLISKYCHNVFCRNEEDGDLIKHFKRNDLKVAEENVIIRVSLVSNIICRKR